MKGSFDNTGGANVTFTVTGLGPGGLTGHKATVVYDSNQQYDPANSTLGNTYSLGVTSTGVLNDVLGANNDAYQFKIWQIQ